MKAFWTNALKMFFETKHFFHRLLSLYFFATSCKLKTRKPAAGWKRTLIELKFSEVDGVPPNMNAEGPELSLKEFSQQCVEAHNSYRRLHGVAELKYSEKLTADAKKYIFLIFWTWVEAVDIWTTTKSITSIETDFKKLMQ